MNNETIPGRLTLTEGNVATFAERPNEPDAPRRFEMLAYSGGMMTGTPIGNVIVDLAGINANGERKPILQEHDRKRIVGHSDRITKAGNLSLSGSISRKTPAGREVSDLADEGFPWQASMGIDMQKLEVVKPGKTVIVNDREVKGPAVVVRQCLLKESSFVPLGADSATSAAVFSDNGCPIPIPTEKPMDIESFKTFAAANPDATKEFYEQGYNAAKSELAPKPATLQDLTAAFSDKGFIIDMLGKSATLDQARAEFADVLKVQLADRDTKLAEMQKRLDLAGKGAAPLDLAGGDTSTPADPATIEDPKLRAAAEWDAKFSDCQNFSSKDSYVNYRASVLTGQLKVLQSAPQK